MNPISLSIIENRLTLMQAIISQKQNLNLDLLEAYNHDIQDCLYWLKKDLYNDE